MWKAGQIIKVIYTHEYRLAKVIGSSRVTKTSNRYWNHVEVEFLDNGERREYVIHDLRLEEASPKEIVAWRTRKQNEER